jgi:hypothetical protein
MSDDVLTTLLPALDIAAFERRADGSFAPIAPVPGWFTRLTRDATFPFLGHILEEAREFWSGRGTTRRDWGPCAEVDESGREFHYKVAAVAVEGRQYLLFQLDPQSDWIRDVLQKVREQALAAEQHAAAPSSTETIHDVRKTAGEIRDLLARLLASASDAQAADGRILLAKCDDLLNRVDALVRSASISSGGVPGTAQH